MTEKKVPKTVVEPVVPASGPLAFPYKTMAEAVRDRFAKVGGSDEAFRFLVKGFKTIAWRKKTEASAKERDAAHEAAISSGRED